MAFLITLSVVVEQYVISLYDYFMRIIPRNLNGFMFYKCLFNVLILNPQFTLFWESSLNVQIMLK
ncbi:hypothetical protein J18TS1_00690 [Oceanobacillus oncorhynchi subsp. incaldanensis]|nr:hypothetical protein J18TS1_00690 [Oceanobacillus oncorhynchi subsp. incaldanensis]